MKGRRSSAIKHPTFRSEHGTNLHHRTPHVILNFSQDVSSVKKELKLRSLTRCRCQNHMINFLFFLKCIIVFLRKKRHTDVTLGVMLEKLDELSEVMYMRHGGGGGGHQLQLSQSSSLITMITDLRHFCKTTIFHQKWLILVNFNFPWFFLSPWIYSGATPYASIPCEKLFEMLLNGYRLPLPKHACDQLWVGLLFWLVTEHFINRLFWKNK